MDAGNTQLSVWQNDTMVENQFLKDVVQGLRSEPKHLLSKYFYDKKGDYLFQQIMTCEDYYPTRCEMEILKEQTKDIVNYLLFDIPKVDVIELGPGDATKSVQLIRYLFSQKALGSYIPIDISDHIIHSLEEKFSKEFDGLSIRGFAGEYFQRLPDAISVTANPKIILFLGGNACNYRPSVTLSIFRKLNCLMQSGDSLLIGFDLKKDPRIIRAAYNDRNGITARFNLNLLTRINRELGGNFQLKNFSHYSSYDPQIGASKSFLISENNQKVEIAGETFSFKNGEPIFMEISQKYDVHSIENLAVESGFVQKKLFTDHRHYFSEALWQKE